MRLHLVILTSPGLSFFNVNSSDTAELLRPDEHIFFSDGLSPFYDHVMTLLASVKANTHVVEFANLALQAHAQQRPEPKGLGSEPDKKEMVNKAHHFHTLGLLISYF